MDREAILDEFRAAGAYLEGHFILSSGRHSPVYLQCARVLMDPRRAARLCAALADRLREAGLAEGIELVVSPAMGGVIVGYEMGRQLGAPAIFAERVEGRLMLRRGFAINPAQRILMVEDVVTTGLSSRETLDLIRAHGGEPVAAAALVDRSGGRADLGVPFVALLEIDAPSFAPEEVPEWLARIPAEKPGSRHLAAKAAGGG